MKSENLTFEFRTKYIDVIGAFPLIEKDIIDFYKKYFGDFPIQHMVEIILSDNVSITRSEFEDTVEISDIIEGCVLFIDGHFILILFINYFIFQLDPSKKEGKSEEFVNDCIKNKNHLLYHEMMHIKNRYDFPLLFEEPISTRLNWFEDITNKFLDEYFATYFSQKEFPTIVPEKMAEEFCKRFHDFQLKFSENRVSTKDISDLLKFYCQILALNQINVESSEDNKQLITLLQTIENGDYDFERRLFTNIKDGLSDFSTHNNLKRLVIDIRKIINTFSRLTIRRE